MAKRSAGMLLYRTGGRGIEVLLGHPGGPFFRNRDDGAWTLPKGLVEEDEEPLDTARREFVEETGLNALPGDEDAFLELGDVRYRSGKVVRAWAFEGDCDPECLESNTFELEWPPRSGRTVEVPELDRFAFFTLERASDKVHPAQRPFLDRLRQSLDADSGAG